ncbi:Gfo/Idh/MocA family protein [Kitasatospora azatica]|uniref:Gfo/Idh/MocA family protein n=1 Tax=Kitasatospora azatica TaxID=58347 RepID=UPI000690FAFE|nr:Gfo/Idh/MocA family oxidoreductase [Kitasatospora azatica]
MSTRTDPGPKTGPRPLAVIGLGVISRFYLAAIEADPAFRLAAVCDLNEAALRDATVPAYRDHRAMLAAHPELAGVVVTVPDDAHAALCRDLLAAGLPVCVEKPLATRLAEARALTALAAERGTVLFTAFHRRYNAPVLALPAAPADNPVRRVRVRYFERIEEYVGRDRWYLDPARCGGGCVADNGPNAFDLVRLLLGEAELTVTRVRIDRDARGLDRQAVIELATAGPTPSRARVELDWSYPGELKDVEVTLADGTVHRADLLAGHPGFKESLWHEYRGILAAFGAALDDPAAHRDGGLAALELVHAAYRLDGEQATHIAIRIPQEAR